MDVQDVYLLVFWLLPGLVIGVLGTLMIQRLTSQYVSPKKAKVDTKITGYSERMMASTSFWHMICICPALDGYTKHHIAAI